MYLLYSYIDYWDFLQKRFRISVTFSLFYHLLCCVLLPVFFFFFCHLFCIFISAFSVYYSCSLCPDILGFVLSSGFSSVFSTLFQSPECLHFVPYLLVLLRLLLFISNFFLSFVVPLDNELRNLPSWITSLKISPVKDYI